MIGALLQCAAGVGLVVLLRWAIRTVARPAPRATDAEMRARARDELLPPASVPLTCRVCGTPVVVSRGPGTVALFDRPGFADPVGGAPEPHRCPGWAIVRWARLGMAAGAGREGRR